MITLLLVKYIECIVFFDLQLLKGKQQFVTCFLRPKLLRRTLLLVLKTLNTSVKLTFKFINKTFRQTVKGPLKRHPLSASFLIYPPDQTQTRRISFILTLKYFIRTLLLSCKRPYMLCVAFLMFSVF